MSTSLPAEPWHQHDNSCYWDHTRCGWVCPQPEAALPRVELSAADLPEPPAQDPARPPARAAAP